MKEIEINNSLFEIQELAEEYLHINNRKDNTGKMFNVDLSQWVSFKK